MEKSKETVQLVSVTPDAEKHMAFCARVSNPNRSKDTDPAKLLSYCIKNKHWSVFESAYMTLCITTTVAISRQILRHRSFTFQEFSQRYSSVGSFGDFPEIELRRQDSKNRQNSIADLDPYLVDIYQDRIETLFAATKMLYQDMLDVGIAKECARFILPMATPTTLYMTGNCRQWVHYIQLRSGNGTQLEHKDVAEKCKQVFVSQFPMVSRALNFTSEIREM